MLFEEMMKDEFKAGKAEAFQESILEFLSDIAPVPDSLRGRILSVEKLETLKLLNKKPASVSSIEEFEQIEF